MATKITNTQAFSSSGFISGTNITLPITEDKILTLLCGRYFGPEHPKSQIHQLSSRLRKSKYDETQNELLSAILSTVLTSIGENIGAIDGVTRVPPRPNKRDRLSPIFEKIGEQTNYTNYSESIICATDYPPQKGLNKEARLSNVKDRFRVLENVKNKHIVLIDDILTTGATISECCSKLMEKGASKVTVVVFGINQFTPLWGQKKDLICSRCGGKMTLKLRNDGTTAFYGCSNYQTNKCRNSLDVLEGWHRFNEINQIEVDIEKEEQDDLFDF